MTYVRLLANRCAEIVQYVDSVYGIAGHNGRQWRFYCLRFVFDWLDDPSGMYDEHVMSKDVKIRFPTKFPAVPDQDERIMGGNLNVFNFGDLCFVREYNIHVDESNSMTKSRVYNNKNFDCQRRGEHKFHFCRPISYTIKCDLLAL